MCLCLCDTKQWQYLPIFSGETWCAQNCRKINFVSALQPSYIQSMTNELLNKQLSHMHTHQLVHNTAHIIADSLCLQRIWKWWTKMKNVQHIAHSSNGSTQSVIEEREKKRRTIKDTKNWLSLPFQLLKVMLCVCVCVKLMISMPFKICTPCIFLCASSFALCSAFISFWFQSQQFFTVADYSILFCVSF